jgi:hypothetical protein
VIPLTIQKTLQAGAEIDSRCLKCKDVTNHTIIAMADEKVVKVTCNVCGGRHNYRPPVQADKGNGAKGSAAKRTASRATGITRAAKAVAHFEEMIQGRDPASAIAYSMTATFRVNDLLNHPMFGLGLVTAAIKPDKVEVLFKEGSKLFICKLP